MFFVFFNPLLGVLKLNETLFFLFDIKYYWNNSKYACKFCFPVLGLDDVKSSLLVLVSVLVLSPILKTLTDSISTDTIYAMTVSTISWSSRWYLGCTLSGKFWSFFFQYRNKYCSTSYFTSRGTCILWYAISCEYGSIFVWFMTMREKKILARAIGIQIEGNHAFFRDN